MDVSAIKKVFLGMVAVLLFSCSEKEQRPDDILHHETMINMMIDLRILEGKVAVLTLGNDSSRVLYRELEKRVFDEYEVDSATYVKSYQYYMLRPEQALYITDAVIDSLKVLQQIKETGKRPDR